MNQKIISVSKSKDRLCNINTNEFDHLLSKDIGEDC